MTYETDVKELKRLLHDYWKNKKEDITEEQVYQWMKFAYLMGNRIKESKGRIK